MTSSPLRIVAAVFGAVVLLSSCSATVGAPEEGVTATSESTGAGVVESAQEAFNHRLGDALRAGSPVDVRPVTSSDGLPPVVSSIDTSDKVVFLTIDDGASKVPAVADLLAETGVPVTPFLTTNVVSGSRKYFAKISEADGQTIQNHSVTHSEMRSLSDAGQRDEICDASDKLASWFGATPWMFRPPYGEYNTTTREAAKACGIDYLVLWTVSLPGCCLRYQVGDELRPGDIILTHWREDLADDLLYTLKIIHAQGFKVAALQDYLPASK